MRDHGLITVNRTLGWISKYAEALGSSDQSMRAGQSFNGGRFIAFMQLISGPAFDLLVESMQYAHDVRKYIFRLVACTVVYCLSMRYNPISNLNYIWQAL